MSVKTFEEYVKELGKIYENKLYVPVSVPMPKSMRTELGVRLTTEGLTKIGFGFITILALLDRDPRMISIIQEYKKFCQKKSWTRIPKGAQEDNPKSEIDNSFDLLREADIEDIYDILEAIEDETQK